MADTPLDAEPRLSKKVTKIVLLILVGLFMLVLVSLTSAPLVWWFYFHGEKLPEGMMQMSGTAVGLLFGAVFMMIKDAMGFD